MTSMAPDSKRRPVPRWRSAAQAVACGELRSTATPANEGVIRSEDFDALLHQWKVERSTENAADLVASAVVLGRQKEAIDAAIFLTQRGADAAPLVRNMAQRVLGEEKLAAAKALPDFHLDRQVLHANIARLKLRVRTYPRNPVAWMDLARCQTVLGQLDVAARAVRVAVALAPENRFVLRSASRFFVHLDQPEQALELLRAARALRVDPWLMSAELSIAMIAGADPQSYKRAKAIVDADELEPWHTGELHGALGTMALSDRRVGKVGKLFTRSLRKPTENVIAQAQWAANAHAAVDVSDALIASQPSHEALALRARAQGEWPQVIDACFRWSAMEPTSARPLVMGAYVAGVALADGGAMLQFTERLMLGASHDPMVMNNHAVALAYVGRLADAEATLDRINPKSLTDYLKVFYEATRGLIAYRRGQRAVGMHLYLQAAESPGAKDDPVVAGPLMWHLLREEARLQTPGTAELADALWKKTQALPMPELRGIRKSVLDALALPTPIATAENPVENEASLHEQVIAQFPDGTALTVRR